MSYDSLNPKQFFSRASGSGARPGEGVPGSRVQGGGGPHRVFFWGVFCVLCVQCFACFPQDTGAKEGVRSGCVGPDQQELRISFGLAVPPKGYTLLSGSEGAGVGLRHVPGLLLGSS